MSSSGRRRFLVRRPTVVDLGCSCRPGTKLSSLFNFQLLKRKPKPNRAPKHYFQPLSSSSTTTAATSPWATSHHPSSLSTTTTSLQGEDTSSPYSHATWARNETANTPKKTPTTTRGAGSSKGWAGESVAVVKDSDDPYTDFRESMLQMVMETEIYAWKDLLELLNSFLALNAPCHHDLIVRAFVEIWSGVFSSSMPASGSADAAMHGKQTRPRRRHLSGGRRQRAGQHQPSRAA